MPDKKIFNNIGNKNDTDLQRSISLIEKQSKLLAKSVNSIFNLQKSEIYLSTIFIPFLAHAMQNSILTHLKNPDELIFRNFAEFYVDFNGEDYYGTTKAFERDLNWHGGDYDFVVTTPVNIYERMAYSICRISFHELRYDSYKTSIKIDPNIMARKMLKEIVKKNKSIFPNPNIVDFLPCTLFEGLTNPVDTSKYPKAKVHWLGQIHNEYYIFYLAYLKEFGTKIIGQVHGGGFSQMRYLFGNEIAEIMLADEHHSPKWNLASRVFPNQRASRNLFINLKYIYHQKRKDKLLVLIQHCMPDTHPRNGIFYDGSITASEFYNNQLRKLGEHFRGSFDFKTHSMKTDFSEKLLYLKDLYPDSFFISDVSTQEISRNYEGVIHLDTWGTAIIELAGTNIPQYVYLGPELLLNEGYESFLWNTKKSSTRNSYANGAYVEVNNNKYKAAYGASYFYPFYFSKLIRKLMAQFREMWPADVEISRK